MHKVERSDASDSQTVVRMVDACIEAGRLVDAAGSQDLRTAMRIVLFILGREIAQRERSCEGAGSAREDPELPRTLDLLKRRHRRR